MKDVIKDTQLNIRINSEVLAEMRVAAKESHLNMSDYIVQLFRQANQNTVTEDNMLARLVALENAVFSKSAA